MKCFVISLMKEQKRRQHITREFSSQNIPFNFFDAITPEQIDDEASRLKVNIKNTKMSKGEVACLLSHMAILQHAVDEGFPYVSIFEDDIHLGIDASRYLCTDDWIPENMQFIKLEMFNNIAKGSFWNNHEIDGQRGLFKLEGRHLGAAGYLVSTRLAQVILEEIRQYGELIPIDKVVFEDLILLQKIDVYQLQPAICVQDDILDRKNSLLHSSLDQDRELQAKEKMNISQKIKREIERLLCRRIQFK